MYKSIAEIFAERKTLIHWIDEEDPQLKAELLQKDFMTFEPVSVESKEESS